uniref:CCR4-NOT transcription complex subunit 10 n=1 Tax=Macrostomum lignano TaxID=282301 RepID=A0A1I8JAL0_9PLAT
MQQTSSSSFGVGDDVAVGDGASASAAAPTPPVEQYTAEERQMAQRAAEALSAGESGGLLAAANQRPTKPEQVKQLCSAHPADWAAQQNRAVADYVRSAYFRTEEFRQTLFNVASTAKFSIDACDQIEEPDSAVLFYNLALLNFYQRQHLEARRILKAMLPLSELLEPAFYRALVMLLLDTFLKLQCPEDAIQLLADGEKVVSQADETDSALSASAVESDGGDPGRGRGAGGLERAKSDLCLIRIAALLMRRDLGSAKQLIKANRQHPSADFTRTLQFHRAHLAYLAGNLRKALRLMHDIPGTPRSPTDTGECEAVMQWNNLACVHFHLGKHNLGAFYLKRAIKENEKACSDYQAKKANGKGSHVLHHQIPLRAYSISRHYELLHNLGLELLFSGKPVQAFDYLLEVINVYPRNPRLWLRLAECSIKYQRLSNSADREFRIRQRAVKGVVGSGRHRKLLLGTGVQEIKKPWEESAAMPTPTLEFASLCVRNALLLLPQEPPFPHGDTDYHGHVLRWAETLCLPLSPAGFLRGVQLIQFRASVLTSAAYIALCLCDHLQALRYCNQLLSQPALSDCQLYLGKMYLAEAKVNLQVPEHISKDYLNDAVQLLNPASVTRVDVLPAQPPRPDDWPKRKESPAPSVSQWTPDNVLEAQNIMKYNLSVVYAIKGDFDLARQHLQDVVYNPKGQGMSPPFPAHFYFFKLYLDLMQGRRSFAQLLLKETFGHLTPNPPNWRSKPAAAAPAVAPPDASAVQPPQGALPQQ